MNNKKSRVQAAEMKCLRRKTKVRKTIPSGREAAKEGMGSQKDRDEKNRKSWNTDIEDYRKNMEGDWGLAFTFS